MANPNENPSTKPEKTEKTDAPQNGYTWGQRAEIALLGATGTAVGIGVAAGVGELAKRTLGRKVVDDGARRAAAFGRRVAGLFSR